MDENLTESIAATQTFISKIFPRHAGSKNTFSKIFRAGRPAGPARHRSVTPMNKCMEAAIKSSKAGSFDFQESYRIQVSINIIPIAPHAWIRVAGLEARLASAWLGLAWDPSCGTPRGKTDLPQTQHAQGHNKPHRVLAALASNP